jgi:hypothetical protein
MTLLQRGYSSGTIHIRIIIQKNKSTEEALQNPNKNSEGNDCELRD